MTNNFSRWFIARSATRLHHPGNPDLVRISQRAGVAPARNPA